MTLDETEYVQLVSEPRRPGPGARVTRTAGQVGGAVVVLELAEAFSWFGSGRWSADQWRAVTAAGVFAVSVGQNVAGWFRERGRSGRLTGAGE